MRRRVAGIAGAALLIGLQSGLGLHAQAPTDGELRRLGDAYAQAWGKGDAKALAILHATEAIRIGADGKVAVGRAAIQQAMLEALTGPYPRNQARRHRRSGHACRAGRVRDRGNVSDCRRHAAVRCPDTMALPSDARAHEWTMADRGRCRHRPAPPAEVIHPAARPGDVRLIPPALSPSGVRACQPARFALSP